MSPVEPMYMAGRLRTASRPSRMLIEDASYAVLFLPVVVVPVVANTISLVVLVPIFVSSTVLLNLMPLPRLLAARNRLRKFLLLGRPHRSRSRTDLRSR